MKYFKYKAVAPSGELISGVAEVPGVLELSHSLSTRGLTLLSYRRAMSWHLTRSARWSRRDLINFIFHLEQMIAAGIPMLEALKEFGQGVDKKPVTRVIDAVIEKIDGGQSLSRACSTMPDTFSPLVVSMLEAGEQSGRIEQVLGELGELLKWQEESVSRLKRVLIYPSFVAAVLFIVILFVMTWLVPGMVAFISSAGATLPWHTKALIATSALVTEYWLMATLIIVASIVGGRLIAFTDKRFQLLIDRFKLRIPLIGPVMFKTRLARFSRCVSMMYNAGINIIEALRFAKGTLDNRLMEAEIDQISQRLVDGQGIAGSFSEANSYPPLVARILRIGESTGALDVSFNQLSDIYDRESKHHMEKLEQSLGPIMTVVVGVIMMWVVVSVIGPIYDLVFGMSGGQL